MQPNDVIPNLDDDFQSFNQMLGVQIPTDNWSEALMHIGHWRGDVAVLLRGVIKETIPGDDIKILSLPVDSEGLKLRVPEKAATADIERALHTIITIIKFATCKDCCFASLTRGLDVDKLAGDQVANVLGYQSEVLSEVLQKAEKRGWDISQIRGPYEQYGEQVARLIFATRDSVNRNVHLLDGMAR